MRSFRLRHFLAGLVGLACDAAKAAFCEPPPAFQYDVRLDGETYPPDSAPDRVTVGGVEVPAWPVAPGVLQGPIAIGDTFIREPDRETAWEAIEDLGGDWRLESAHAFELATAAELLDPAGPWKRCEARAVQRVRGECEHPHADRYMSYGHEFCGAEGCGKRLVEMQEPVHYAFSVFGRERCPAPDGTPSSMNPSEVTCAVCLRALGPTDEVLP